VDAVPVRIGERYQGRYQVVARIGEGAFAYVYQARDESGQELALKVLKESYLAEREVAERFQREIFAVASINSPHVIGLTDFGMSDQDFFMVTELVRGPTLRELLKKQRFSADEVEVVVGQIAHALAAAHAQDIVHRDLKPENVMLVGRGGAWQAKVLDFGFAKLPEIERKLDLAPLTRPRHLFGTPQYLSPEQIRGRPLDGGADLFALGVMTYEMLSGKRPWDGAEPMEIMTAVLRNLPPALPSLPPGLGERIDALNAFMLRALAKERAERPPSAEAFYGELVTALRGEGVGALPLKALSQVSSQSIELRLTRREDETEVSLPEDSTIPLAVSGVPNDTIPSPAMPSDKILVDTGSVPIDVDEPGNTGKRTTPFGRRSTEPTPPPRRRLAWLWLLLLVVAVAGAAFLAGRLTR
jgi:serine/threonine protein kinase